MRVHLQIILRIMIAIVVTLLVNPASAADLREIYQQALMHDPTFQKAQATRMAQGEQLPQQVAALLPTVAATGNIAWNRNLTLRAVPPAFVPPGVTTFQTKSYLLTFTQPLFNINNWFLATQASAVDKQAEATLFAASQDLMVRVVRAYLAVLNSLDDVRYTRAEREANAKQLALSKERYKLGVDIVTGIYNSQAAYDVSAVQLIVAENNLRNNLLALSLLTGQKYTVVDPLRRAVPLLRPSPSNPHEWVEAAAKHNWTLIASRYAVIASREHVKASFSNHYPTVSLVASTGPSYGQSTGTVDTMNNAVGLQLNVPLFQGGLVVSQTRQAKDEYAAACADMDNSYLQATTDVQQRFNDVLSGVANIEADRRAVASAGKSLKSTQEAYKFGTRSIFDVLSAQRDLYRAQRQSAADQYLYLMNSILIKQASGNLTLLDLNYINQLLH